ncbi:MAG TPA: TonB-dependent receptor [Bryobacteraceae bacterium]|nr:TonB-dependent receptor [Bryobacteraceae bacterium]
MRSFLLIAAVLTCFGQNHTEGKSDTAEIPVLRQSVVITATPVEPAIDRRNAEIFERTLFSRDDQIFHALEAGINAGQHEGGGKSLEIRRFGFNLDHGGVNGGLKVLVDDVQQNQGTQGHGQGYLGALKSLTPELVQEVSIINGPFSAEYGDFSGLGVVHIKLRESLPDQITARIQGGSFNTYRGFLGFSPELKNADGLLAYEGSYSEGPFQNPLNYRRDNFTGNYTRRLSSRRSLGFRFNAARSDFLSSGQVPLDEVAAGRLDRFGFVDATDGGRVRSGTAALYYRQDSSKGDTFKIDGFAGRSLFDLYSNFTFFLNDPAHGDAIQQHDSRLQEGANAQYLRPHRLGAVQGLLTGGGNFHGNQIHVGLYPRQGRDPSGVAARAHARVTNGAGYAQESLTFFHGKLLAGGGLRFDQFAFEVKDRVNPALGGSESAGRWQPKGSLAYTPARRLPLTFYANYGRGISTIDARAVVQYPRNARIATTDFYQLGSSFRRGRFSVSTDGFWIDRSHEQVYIPDDGTFEFNGPSRAYGFETKAAVEITHKVTLNGGLTKVANAFYRGALPRIYVDSAPHFAADAGLTVSSWKGWSGSLRMRAINHYRLDGGDPSIVAGGLTVFDLGVSRRIRRGVEFNIALDNLTNREFYETQNYFESRLPGQPAVSRIHGTPGYPLTAMVGMTFRLRGK